MISGDELERMLENTMQAKAQCRKCGAGISFEEGANVARNHGITGKVVMCKHCQSVYEVNVRPRGLTLLADVTGSYRPATQAGAKHSQMPPPAKKWWQFWK